MGLGVGQLNLTDDRNEKLCVAAVASCCARVNRDIFGYEPESLIKASPTSIMRILRLFNCALMGALDDAETFRHVFFSLHSHFT